ncbi:MerR family transcriptional regulator, partial [bacterium]|nr:MerR family transcriptional regulator [bacterium]
MYSSYEWRRTIRYYIQEGLLEPPAGRGRGGFYYDSHLQI